MDIMGEMMHCRQDWNDPMIVDQFRSAVNALHAARDQRGNFQSSCADCIKQDLDNPAILGCRRHRGTPRLYFTGYPTHSTPWENYFCQNMIDGSSYRPNGDSAITPHEMMRVRQYLLSQNTCKL
jgi:hypothetical protein